MKWLAFLAFIKRIPIEVWVILALLCATGYYGHTRYKAGAAHVQSKWDDEKAVIAAEAEKAKKEAAAKEAAALAAIQNAAANLKQENANALAERDSLIRDLRAGRVRVREALRCPSRVPEAAGSAGPDHGASEGGLSDKDAEFLIRLASEADAAARRLTACQTILETERQSPALQ